MKKTEWEVSVLPTLVNDLYKLEREKLIEATQTGVTYQPPSSNDLMKTLMAASQRKDAAHDAKGSSLQQHGLFHRSSQSETITPKPGTPSRKA